MSGRNDIEVIRQPTQSIMTVTSVASKSESHKDVYRSLAQYQYFLAFRLPVFNKLELS